MSGYQSHQNIRVRQALSNPVEGYPVDAIKKMAVLFTDIVGSSQFFRTRGDIAGREMLQRHQDMASPPIIAHGGVVVKMLGDSVMAYFLDAREALKAAIKIQETFKQHNLHKEPGDQIHIRLGIHFGDGIVEEADIFGDVVNMAAKFLPLVKGDQIVITQEVCDQVQGQSAIRLEAVNTSDSASLPKGLIIYNVIWDQSVNLDPLMKTLLYFRPLFRLGKENFARTWDLLLQTKDNFWFGRTEKESILSDKSIVLIVNEAPLSVTIAKSVIEFLKINLGKEGSPFVPVQIVIDAGPYLRVGKLTLEGLRVNWEELKPGEVYITPAAYHLMRHVDGLSVSPPQENVEPKGFYRINLADQRKREGFLFLYQNALVQGEHRPCFYCGDRRHYTTACPSKQLTEVTSGLSHLGYLPVDEINTAYFNYLNRNSSGSGLRVENAAGAATPEQWACHGLYELKMVYQLRFFRTIWNAREDNWNRIRERKDDRENGGLVWIGLDCIRVSNLEQAGFVLMDALKKKPNDYKVHCALAFLSIEKYDFPQAKYYLMKALEQTETSPQKIFLLLLLSRVYDLNGDRMRAEETIRKIMHINDFTYEAFYQDILFQFRKGKEAVALHQLVKLIKKNREYYLHALIDPELCNFSEAIHRKLEDLLLEAKNEAKEVTARAEEALGKIRKWLEDNEKEVVEAQSLWEKIQERSKGSSYFGYLDIIHYSNSIIGISRTSLEYRRKNLLGQIRRLKSRVEQYTAYIESYPYASLIASVKKELNKVRERVFKDWGMDQPRAAGKFKEAFALIEELTGLLDQIGVRLQKLEVIRRFLVFITGFFKKSLIFQSANIFVAIILFPILAYYLNFLIPGLEINPQNIWNYQKAVLILGSASALVLAAVTTDKGPSGR